MLQATEPFTTEIDAPELANVLVEEIFSKFGTPRSIVSDRGSIFTSVYWSTFCYYLVVKRRVSTAFHPQTDGQTERMNQTLECYLRCYINYQQDDWVKYLPSAEFAYNQSVNATTGKSPFEIVLRFQPAFQRQIEREAPAQGRENPAARSTAEALTEALQESKSLWEKAQESTTKYYNRRHQDKSFAVGDDVMLSSRHIRMRKASKKLADKFLGPFKVMEAIGKNAYKLDLPKSYGRIHRTFHVALLEPYSRREGQEPPEPIPVEGEDEWAVERILDERETQGKRMFLVRWDGFTAENDTWEPEQHLVNAQEKVATFYKEREESSISLLQLQPNQ